MIEPTSLPELARRLTDLGPSIHGTLRVFGDWFGRPYDNDHSLRSARAQGPRLVLEFDDDESLTVWNPRGVSLERAGLRIAEADRVRWEYFYYGRPKLPENRYVIEHVADQGSVRATSTEDWFVPHFMASVDEPAVELLNPVPPA